MRTIKADEIVNAMLTQYNKALADQFKSDVITIKSPIRVGLDDIIRLDVENLHRKPDDRPKRLTVLLETTGGYIETVERIYNVFRKHYELVDFVVPNFAYSAGTVLVLSGDEIYMDYYSVLGPIDPQLELEDGNWVPGLGYLHKFQELSEVINKASNPQSVRAELAYLLKKFDPANLFALEQAKSHSESLLEEWLPKHKFKNWTITKTSKQKVTPARKKRRAHEIADALGSPSKWHSHGRGIGIKELDALKLQITDFGADQELSTKIRQYYELVVDYCQKLGATGPQSTVIHTQNGGLRRYS